jgi:putative intracellular protease/amidase
MFLIEK